MKSVLFDVDGTLLNTHEFIVSAFEYAVKSIGKPITRNEAEDFMRTGLKLPEIYAQMLPTENADLLARRHREFQSKNLHLATAFDGAEEALQSLKNQGFKLAAVTNRARSSVLPTLEITKLLSLFDACVCPEDTLLSKPDPEHIHTALRALQSAPEFAWMVGDTAVDIEAARAAGVRAIGISHTKRLDLFKEPPERTVFTLAEILPIVSS